MAHTKLAKPRWVMIDHYVGGCVFTKVLAVEVYPTHEYYDGIIYKDPDKDDLWCAERWMVDEDDAILGHFKTRKEAKTVLLADALLDPPGGG